MAENLKKPTTHFELDHLIEEKLAPVCKSLVEEHEVTFLVICAIEHGAESSVLSCMQADDAVKHLEAALEMFRKDRAPKRMGSA